MIEDRSQQNNIIYNLNVLLDNGGDDEGIYVDESPWEKVLEMWLTMVKMNNFMTMIIWHHEDLLFKILFFVINVFLNFMFVTCIIFTFISTPIVCCCENIEKYISEHIFIDLI